ncbi:hypothetical protein [Acidianus manzaensis]|uniref:Uncharacterized protein n=1 Tax=Acidianus manzaensis TaxID=282676 RepID=A0A1W6K301_9CREN|nr:hypothetical protein [Acidianus manzaensis]ARM76824.1 hypothetical protein B6F84_12880 [Acidianus manzaensis]
MPSEVTDELILIIMVVVIGLVVVGFTFGYLAPQIALSNAENVASNLASSSSVSVGPLIIGNGDTGSIVTELYNPSTSGTACIIAFVEPSYMEASAGVVTPSSTPSFTVYCPNGSQASTTTLTKILDTNGRTLFQSEITAYKINFNTPVTININNVNPADIVIIWFIVNEGGYVFRIGYTYTGIPSSTGAS